MKIINSVCALLAVVSLSACVNMPQPLYDWGGYESSLYKYYKKPARAEKHTEVLQAIVTAEENGKVVPPGLRAELGFMLLESGDSAGATELFQKEKLAFPESATLMDRLIEQANR